MGIVYIYSIQPFCSMVEQPNLVPSKYDEVLLKLVKHSAYGCSTKNSIWDTSVIGPNT